VGVFDSLGRSTSNAQLVALNVIGWDVTPYDFRQKAREMGVEERDKLLEKTVKDGDFDLVLFSKCNTVSYRTFEYINSLTTTCFWFCDPMSGYNEEMQRKTSLVNYACFDKQNVLEAALQLNPNSCRVCEGFDSFTHEPCEYIREGCDVGFIGDIYGDRQMRLDAIEKDVKIFNKVYGTEHDKYVSYSKINLNFCTHMGASDRVYKILAARGFLLSDDWVGRSEHFQDGIDLVIYSDGNDLNEKIEYYLHNDEKRREIATNGHLAVQEFTCINWAKGIAQHCKLDVVKSKMVNKRLLSDGFEKLSILVPTFENPKYLKLCIETLKKETSVPYEIIVHVNGRCEETLKYVKEQNIKFSFSEENLGVCRAFNSARGLATGNLLCLVSDDHVVMPDWDREVFNCIEKFELPKEAILPFMYMEPRGHDPDYIAPVDYGNTIDEFDYSRLLNDLEKLKRVKPECDIKDWPSPWGNAGFIHPDVWDSVGGLSEEYDRWHGRGSDPDFLAKVYQKGVRCFATCGRSLVYHFGEIKSATLPFSYEPRAYFQKKFGISYFSFSNSIDEKTKVECQDVLLASSSSSVAPTIPLSGSDNLEYVVILSLWKRGQWLAEQLEIFKNQTYPPKEIWLCHGMNKTNEGFVGSHLSKQFDRIAWPKDGGTVFSRFEMAHESDEKLFLIIDDDMFPTEDYLENAIDFYRETGECIVASSGRVFYNEEGYCPFLAYGSFGDGSQTRSVHIGCNGWLLSKESIDVLLQHRLDNDYNNGEDIALSFINRRIRGVETYVIEQTPIMNSDRYGHARGFGEEALSHTSKHEEFFKQRDEIVTHYLREMGYKCPRVGESIEVAGEEYFRSRFGQEISPDVPSANFEIDSDGFWVR